MIALIYIVNIIIESGVLFAFSYSSLENMKLLSIYECITSMGILLIVVFLEKTIKINPKDLGWNGCLWLFLLSIPVVSIGMVVTLIYVEQFSDIVIVIEVSGLLLINLIIFYLYDALQKFYVQKREREMFKQQIILYDNELEIMKKSYCNVRSLRHDMKHHLKELKFLSSKEDTEEILLYIAEMEKSIYNPDEYVESGNKEIDSTLNYLLQKADKLLEKTEIHIALPENLNIRSFVINVIMGNLLENAIEASEMSAEKYICVDIQTRKNLLFIKVINSFENKIEVQNTHIITSKSSKEKHGMGLKSVEKIVKEEGGEMDISWEKDRFKVAVMLYLSIIRKGNFMILSH